MADVVFLLGAGASRDAGMPLMEELTTAFPDWLKGQKQLPVPAKELKAVFEAAVKITGGATTPNIELVLSFLHSALLFKNDGYASTIKGWNAPFDVPADTIKALITSLQKYIHDKLRTFNPEAGDYLSGLLDFQDDETALDVFTLNYDRIAESVAARYAVRFTTGFGDVWDPGLFDESRWDLRIFKLHGSIDWYRVGNRSIIYQGAPEHYAFPGEVAGELLLYPAEAKVSHAEPYATLMSHFTRALASAKMCIAVGYSFRDRDIKRIVLDRMATNRSLQLLVVKPHAEEVIEQRPDAPDEPTFADFPERVIGLWKTAKEAFENRMIRHRLNEIGNVDVKIGQIRDARNTRNFNHAASVFLDLMETCRNQQMPWKPRPTLLATMVPEFWSALEIELRRLMKWYCDLLSVATARWANVSSVSLSRQRGGLGASFGGLVSFWLLSEGLGFAENAAGGREGIQLVLLKTMEGMILTAVESQYYGWPMPLSAHGEGDTDVNRLSKRVAEVTQLCDELNYWPPATALQANLPIEARQSYDVLVDSLKVMAELLNLISKTGILKLHDHAKGYYYAPKSNDWITVLEGYRERLVPMFKAWKLTSQASGLSFNLQRVIAT